MAKQWREQKRGTVGKGKRETKGSQPKWQLKLHLSVESSVKTGSHLAKLERDQPKVLEQRQTEIEIERKKEGEREGREGRTRSCCAVCAASNQKAIKKYSA